MRLKRISPVSFILVIAFVFVFIAVFAAVAYSTETVVQYDLEKSSDVLNKIAEQRAAEAKLSSGRTGGWTVVVLSFISVCLAAPMMFGKNGIEGVLKQLRGLGRDFRKPARPNSRPRPNVQPAPLLHTPTVQPMMFQPNVLTSPEQTVDRSTEQGQVSDDEQIIDDIDWV